MEMKKYKKRRIWNFITISLFTIHYSLFTASCTTENYDSGDGQYSYLRADFVEIHTIAPKQADFALSDDGDRIAFPAPFAVQWAEKADTFYRALLYYDRKPDGYTPVSLQRVYVLQPIAADEVKNRKFDPVTFESTWLSPCQTSSSSPQSGGLRGAYYLNLSFLIKTGQADDKDAIQSIGVMSEERNDTLCLTLLHDQGNVPQYYSTRVYTSIPLDGTKPVKITVNSYEGSVVRAYPASLP
ncbi:MAG: hypothetical protein IJ605_00395 [Prevotella sp.]|nr:hypothetical protein [Prevotella sp.]